MPRGLLLPRRPAPRSTRGGGVASVGADGGMVRRLRRHCSGKKGIRPGRPTLPPMTVLIPIATDGVAVDPFCIGHVTATRPAVFFFSHPDPLPRPPPPAPPPSPPSRAVGACRPSMVSFCCDACQAVVKKPKAVAHLAACGRAGTLSCIDCGGGFTWGVRFFFFLVLGREGRGGGGGRGPAGEGGGGLWVCVGGGVWVPAPTLPPAVVTPALPPPTPPPPTAVLVP